MYLEDTVRIPLRARDGSVRAYALVDAADAEWVSQWRWCLNSLGYAKRSTERGGVSATILLHRSLLDLPVVSDGRTVDHVNRDKLDNRRANLRIASQAENAQNRPSCIGSTSAHRGVHWDADRRKWKATVAINGKQINLGRFDDEMTAARIAQAARQRLMSHTMD